MAGEAAPRVVSLIGVDPGVSTAGNDDSFIIGACPVDGTVTAVTYTPEAAITGANTNTRAIRVRNRGQAGAGTTVVAELQFDSGVNGVAFDEKAITLSATPANLVVAEGDVLELFSDAVGTGIADPGGTVKVSISRTAGS